MPSNTPETWPPPPTLPPPGQAQNVRWRLPITLPADRNWLVSFTYTEIVFRRPPRQRVFFVFLCVFCLLAALKSLHGLSYRLAHDGVQEVTNWSVILGGILLGLYCSTPKCLTLDLQNRTYRFRYASLPAPKVVTGPLTDVEGLTLVGLRGQPVGPYTIQLKWNEAVAKSRLRPTLGEYGKKPADAAAARTLMRRVAAKFDVPCAYPHLFDIKYPEA